VTTERLCFCFCSTSATKYKKAPWQIRHARALWRRARMHAYIYCAVCACAMYVYDARAVLALPNLYLYMHTTTCRTSTVHGPRSKRGSASLGLLVLPQTPEADEFTSPLLCVVMYVCM